MRTRQITVGFDVEVSAEQVARVLETVFGKATVGQGIPENGLPYGFIYVSNRKRGNHDVESR
jgi:hypothetical protein